VGLTICFWAKATIVQIGITNFFPSSSVGRADGC
jgi:hypothetical protein